MGKKLTAQDVFGGGKPAPQMELTEVEKFNFEVLLQRLALATDQLKQAEAEVKRLDAGVRAVAGQLVFDRGLDQTKFGVNLAAGRILPLEGPGADGSKEEPIPKAP